MADPTRPSNSRKRSQQGSSRPQARQVPVVSPARLAAFDVLERIETSFAHSDDVLHGPRLAPLSQADRDLTMALVLGVLRWQISLDARIFPLLSRPDMTLAGPVLQILRLGAFQLLHMDRIPAHAALNESVELVRHAGHASAAGLVNALLRKLVGVPQMRKPLVEATAALATRLGHPLWMVERWTRQYGRSATEAVCIFDQHEPKCTELFAEIQNAPAPVMDAGSRLVAEIACAAAPESERVWDCCAAPGGKTRILAQRLPEAELLATDSSPVRLRRLTQRLARELPDRKVVCKELDAAMLPSSEGLFDLVLCDVPCSGTGTLARNPEIRHRLREDDLWRQTDRQRRILKKALEHLRPGGRLVYSTCSLEPEECEGVLNSVISQAGNILQRVPVQDVLRNLQQTGNLLTPEVQWQHWLRDGHLRTLPGVAFEGDGFFAAVVERIA